MPTRRNGSETSHATGHRTNASNANGQHNTSKRHQANKAIKVFIDCTRIRSWERGSG